LTILEADNAGVRLNQYIDEVVLLV